MGSRPASVQGRSLAVGVSLAVHVLVLGVVAWRLGTPTAQMTELQAMSVQLVPRPVLRPPPERPREPDTKLARALPSPVVRPGAARPDAVAVPDEKVVGAPLPDLKAGGVQQALRGRLGCDHAALMQLSPQERERCRDRLGAGAPDPTYAKLDLSRGGRIAADDGAPYLRKRPKNGCKVMAGGSATPSGEQGAASGIVCGFDF